MSIDPSNASQTTAATASILPPTGAEEEEESTLVEISPSSSSSPTTVSSLSPSSRTSSASVGDNAEPHPEMNVGIKPTPTIVMATIANTSSSDSSEASTVALVDDLTPQQLHDKQQSLLAPVAEQVASDHPSEQQSRHQIPIQSSSSLSTPSSSEEYDESTVTSSTDGALNVSNSNSQLNNNNTAAAVSEQQVVIQACSIEGVLLPSTTVTVITSTPERVPDSKEKASQSNAPIEIVQIFPSAAAPIFSSATSSSFSSSSPSTSTSTTSSTSSSSSSPSVSPLAVDQQITAKESPSSQVQSNEMKDLVPRKAEPSNAEKSTDETVDQEVPQRQDIIQSSTITRPSSTSEQTTSESRRRRVTFPDDAHLVTGYLESINPWESEPTLNVPELLELYKRSCAKHDTVPLPVVTEHLQELDLSLHQRVPLLSLKDQNLSHGSCEALEEVFKRVQYRSINLSHAGLDDNSASALFNMIEYYEATNELDISDNLAMTNKCWVDCIEMVKRSQALNVLITRGPGISEHYASNLAKALNTSALHTLKLEHCELAQRPLVILCNLLKRNTVLRELSLAYNQLTWEDAKTIASLLESNYHLQLLDISNNNIGDNGIELIVNALIQQSNYFQTMQDRKKKGELSIADLSSSLNSINSNKNYFPNPHSRASQLYQYQHTPKGTHRKDRQKKKQQQLVTVPRLASEATPPVLLDATPMTPPPTPALPNASTPSDVVFLTSPKLQSPAVISQEKEPPPPPSLQEYTTPDDSLELQKQDANSTNDDSGINSSVSSDVDQTNSDSSNVASVEIDQKQLETSCYEEKHLVTMAPLLPPIASDERIDMVSSLLESSSQTNNDNQIDCSSVIVTGDSVNDSGGGRRQVPGDDSEQQLIELTFDVEKEELIDGPKKAKLAKQDILLNKFESIIPEDKHVKIEIEQIDLNPLDMKDAIEEDTPEIRAEDYDDDENLKIVEENLLVDRSINENSNAKNNDLETKDEDGDSGDKNGTSDNDDSASLALIPLKKDELQLRLEKSKQQEKQDDEIDSLTIAPLPVSSLQIVDETNKIDLTPTSASDQLATSPLKIVEVEIVDKPLSRSLDSTGSADFNSCFLGGDQPPAFPNERSFSSESLNSETSVDSNDSKSSLKIIQSKFANRNGTLERQQSNSNKDAQQTEQSPAAPSGLQVLVLWNNEITRNSSHSFAELIEKSSTLEILNVGCNLLCNDFVANIKDSLKCNNSLTSLGLQGAHLSDNGAKVMAEVIEFGGNSTLQRIDMRNNNIMATGLDYLNEALKSNKTVTRVDLDEIPRRAGDNSLEVGSEYSRLLNNIRAQCERNKHPTEPTEPISTSIKRVRAAHLSSRKISLTCTSIRTPPNTAASDKHYQHLLDPSKKNGGRLRSPLPSPTPSPIASPVPSPSRNRFQVTRVGESTGSASSLTSINNNASTSPSPSSTGSSPTLFFAANSRFRVVTVEEPPSSSVANYRSGKISSSSLSPSPLATSGVSRVPPSSSNSAPALSSFVSSPKSSPSPLSQSVATNIPSPPALVQHLKQQTPPPLQQHTQQYPLPPVFTTQAAPPTSKSRHTRLPSTSSTLNDSIISTTSIESPDLEVKRFMSVGTGMHISSGTARTHSSTMDDSCCSSISSSIDSSDNVHFHNTSISSADESFDLVVSSPSSCSLSVGSVSTAPVLKTPCVQPSDCTLVEEQQRINLTPNEAPSLINVNLLKVKNNSLSSLEMSSQESLFDVQELLSLSSSGGGTSLVGDATRLALPTSGNSNESTLTSVQSLGKDKQAVTGKPTEKPPRVRKTSWIASIGTHPKADSSSTALSGSSAGSSSSSGYTPAIEKLLAIFSPSNLFSSSRSSPPSSECGAVPTSASTGAKENAPTANPPSRKESPMGGLFQWSKSPKDEEKVLKVNVSPENTITPQHVQSASHSPQTPQLPTYYVENISSQLKAEIKENISPENTVTNKLFANPLQPAQITTPTSTSAVPPHPKVIFRLGDDYDESEDDIDTLTSKYGRGAGNGGGSAEFIKQPNQAPSTLLGTGTGINTTTSNSGISISSHTAAEGTPTATGILQTSHLGQLARDSLVTMFKNPSLSSQDSNRSIDSLAETTVPTQSSALFPPHDPGDKQSQ
ncbi:serine-rich adhesin for platelets [Topomyia yanbarensis]|uniref:serine-rich adhesin for platelets n=1 Tax=Topomyia yanbarensis TaxID=2498891 RepID=UPI00273AF319|nr:serine-rich adhesin for platelets [Topomyia yanbarensis]XP_058813331.1 serine-rich adhesin for platelets [Topomyia yanbarensis]XP_058813332.1 serine-rich adhesin for platelets [Topomyia yanbarensis]XP_058813333.1 serine-rich adhesin for platelets [Topomyia yanbarensis]XP_058813334.1 serine-rich adhesin for platelets [Topomyia yanbarensis]XP_058813335.1 serine-rich adhesin for platelets [Topomyia yanbarensis]